MYSPIKDLRKPGRTIHVGVILMDSVTETLDVAPIELLTGLTSEWTDLAPETIVPAALKSQTLDIKFHWVNETGKPAKLAAGMNIQVTDTFKTCPPLDIALMGAHSLTYTPNEAELAFVRSTFETCHSFLCICGGMFAPLLAGILTGLNATAPRMMIEQLKQDAPHVKWSERRWQRDGKMWTSGTLLNGTDMMRVWATEVFGGKGTLMERLLEIGAWPIRDVDFKDEDALKAASAADVSNGVSGLKTDQVEVRA